MIQLPGVHRPQNVDFSRKSAREKGFRDVCRWWTSSSSILHLPIPLARPGPFWKGDPWKSCQCRLVTNLLKTGRSCGSKPTPWPFAKCNQGIQEACLNRSLKLNGVVYHSLDGQTPHVPVRDARHHHARKHTLTYLAWWLMYIIQVSSPNTPSTSDLHSNVALAKLSGSTYVLLTYIW